MTLLSVPKGDDMTNLLDAGKQLWLDAVAASLSIFKVMIPIIILVKTLQEFELIAYLAYPLEPLMGFIGLPAEMGLVWATSLLNTTYASLIVFISLAPDLQLTTAQATVTAVLILMAHALPLEGAIARRSGVRFAFQCLVRFSCAYALGWLLNRFYTLTDTLQEPAVILFQAPNAADPSLTAWAMDQGLNLLSIFGVILGLLLMMRLLKALGVIDLMNAALRPLLKLIGIGPKASAITVIGLTMGLSYGGGLIINEANARNVEREDVFHSLTLMGLCHSLIEDTLLLMLIGAHLSGILWGRLAFVLLFMAVLVQIVRRLSPSFQTKYLWVPR